MMKSSLDHLPEHKQHELARVLEILHKEFDDALKGGTAAFNKRGRILKVILFGSYARGDWVEEPHTMKGYRSDYDLLIIVNDRRLTDFASYWCKAADRLLHDKVVTTPVGFIVHSWREVNTALRKGRYFFSDIRREGIVLYERDDEPLTEPRPLTPTEEYRVAKQHFDIRFAEAQLMLKIAQWQSEQSQANAAWRNGAAFSLHQAIEHAYSTALLTLTSYGPPSHNLNFLRTLAEGRDRRLAEAWPRDQQRFRAWFNTINEAYAKARYSEHYEISEEALVWLGERTKILHRLVETICNEHLEQLQNAAATTPKGCPFQNRTGLHLADLIEIGIRRPR